MATATKYKPYSKMKPSGVDWLGKIPDEWEAKRLRYYFDYHAGGVWGDEENGNGNNMICFRVADFDFDHLGLAENDLTVRNIPENQHSRILEKGDILLEKSGGGEKQTVGRAVRFDKDVRAVCSNFIEKLTPLKTHDSKFISYLMGALYFETLNMRSIKQTTGIQNLDLYSYLCEVVPFPSKENQKSIADFLDRETAKIDGVVAKKQKLIELLKEKRQALITHAVTKGFDPKVKIRPSGVDWLGEVPEGWKVKRLRFVMQLNPSKSELSEPSDTLVTFLPMEAVSESGEVNTEQEKEISQVIEGYTYFRDGDVLVAKITPCFENGKGILVSGMKNGIGFGTTEFHVLRSTDIEKEYLYLITTSGQFRKMGEAEMKGAAGQKRVPDEFVKDFVIALPTKKEQLDILKHVRGARNKIDEVIKKVETQIEKLQEYRQALISNAVTGKIKV